jgi:glycosyltransferase involved in cell wall biosynthesis
MTQPSFRASITVRDVPLVQTSLNTASLQFDTNVLANLPKVAVICPTGNRGHLWPLMKHNILKQSYPHDRIVWIIVDDGVKDPVLEANVAEFSLMFSGKVDYRHLDVVDRLILGRKRNLMNELGFAVADICVHMDDDDLYHKESLRVRVALLEMYKSEGVQCVGCTQVNCYDVVTDAAFNAFDPCHAGKPSGFSESTVAYYKEFWTERGWPDDARNAEGHHFMLNRWQKAMNIPSNFVICQLTHDNNTIVRRTYATTEAPIGPDGKRVGGYKDTNMDADERAVVDEVHEAILLRNPNERTAKVFLDVAKTMENDSARLLDVYFRTQWGLESSHRFKVLRRQKITIDHFSHIVSKVPSSQYANLRIAYVCAPSSNPFPWNAFERCPNWGGSEEAVMHITKYFANKMGAKVVVFSHWSKDLIALSGQIADIRKFGREDRSTGVWWKPFEMWNAMDEADLTIVWRDPGSLEGFRDPNHRSGKTCLDIHDQLQVFVPSALNPVDYIMVKSEHHKNTCVPAEHRGKCFVIPNGFDPNVLSGSSTKSSSDREYMFINTSRPDRGMSCLMDVAQDFHVPTNKAQKSGIKQKRSAWAYGFQDMPPELVERWQSRRTRGTILNQTLDIRGKLLEDSVSQMYNNGKYFLYATRFIETDCISLTKAMFYGSFPLVTNVGAVGEKIQKYIRWLETSDFRDVRVPVLYDIPHDRLVPSGYGPNPHPNDASSGLFDARMKAWIESETSKEVTARDQAAMREYVLQTFTWDSVADAWGSSVFDKAMERRNDRVLIQGCNTILQDLQNINQEITSLLLQRRVLLVNPSYESEYDEKVTKVIVGNHQKAAHVLHTSSARQLERFIEMKWLSEAIEGVEKPKHRVKIIIAQGCGLVGLLRRLRTDSDITVVEL